MKMSEVAKAAEEQGHTLLSRIEGESNFYKIFTLPHQRECVCVCVCVWFAWSILSHRLCAPALKTHLSVSVRGVLLANQRKAEALRLIR